ncbi:MAG: carbohydrate ABC transporter permease [Egibacteraceae bacterium]
MNELRRRIGQSEALSGWAFTAPVLIGLAVFLLFPIFMALYISFTDWNGISPPFQAELIGLQNYKDLLVNPGISRLDFAISVRNNLYYVLGVVPLQTSISFVLAVIVNQKFLRGKSFFRSAYYFPSITSSVAISLIFLFLFTQNGAVNKFLSVFIPGDLDVNWLFNANGVIHNALGVIGIETAPGFLATHGFLGQSWWEWLAGPSVALLSIMILATWTTIGTLMLIFLAGLQNIPVELEEASQIDGASRLQHFFRVTLPLMKPTLFFVLTVGIIGSWQVFDQVFVISKGAPQKTTITLAYLVYREGFTNFSMGRATAVAFILFVIIVIFTLVQRRFVNPDEV